MDKSSNAKEGGFEYSKFEIRPYKISELAKIYHINKITFKKWIANLRSKLGTIVGHFLSIEQVEIIVAHLRVPYFVKVEILGEDEFEHVLDEKMKRLPETLNVSAKTVEEKPKRKKTKPIKRKRAKPVKRKSK